MVLMPNMYKIITVKANANEAAQHWKTHKGVWTYGQDCYFAGNCSGELLL